MGKDEIQTQTQIQNGNDIDSKARDYIKNNLTDTPDDEIEQFLANVKTVVNQKIDNIDEKKWLNAYRYKMRELLAQLPLVAERNISLIKLPQCKSVELNPKLWLAYQKRNLAEINNAIKGDVVATTELYKCGRCKQRKCTYTWSQTRSADEGVTMMFRCTNCGLRWTINN